MKRGSRKIRRGGGEPGEKIKFYIWHNGDNSVGIPGGEATVKIYLEPDQVEECREFLASAFGNYFGFRTYVMTEKEYEKYTESTSEE